MFCTVAEYILTFGRVPRQPRIISRSVPSIAGHTPRYGSNSGATHDHIKAEFSTVKAPTTANPTTVGHPGPLPTTANNMVGHAGLLPTTTNKTMGLLGLLPTTANLGKWATINVPVTSHVQHCTANQTSFSARQEAQLEIQHRMATITKYEHCLLHYNDLLTEITEIPDYSFTDDHTIQNCMRKRGDWTERMRQLRMDIIETRNLVTAYSISDYAD